MRTGLFFLLGCTLLSLCLAFAVLYAIRPSHPTAHTKAILLIRKGETQYEITRKLRAADILTDEKKFLWLGRITRQWNKVKAGEYELSPQLSPLSLLTILTSGISITYPITIHEGDNIYEIATDLSKKGFVERAKFLAACKNLEAITTLNLFRNTIPSSLEGYLFPDTYFINHTMNQQAIITQMVKTFLSRWTEQDEKRAQELKMTRHQIVTLASIIEKETGAAEERKLISSVFHNRLKKSMRLQSDPTIIYGIWEHYTGKLSRNDLTTHTPYNTYTINQLPPGPIANPGKEAILAALYPTNSPYLYFVSHNDGTHAFSSTLQEHNHAVKKFQLDPKARIGKSWRDHLVKPASISSTVNQ